MILHYFKNALFRHQGSLKHFTLNVHDEKYYLIPQKKFYSLDDLVANYKAEDVPNLENVSGVRLKEPIPQVQRNVIRRHSESDNVLHTNSRKKTFQNPTKDYSISFDASELRNGVDSNHVSTSSNTMGKVPEIVNESVVSSPVDGRPAEAIPDVVPDHTEVAIGYTKVRNMDLDRTDTLMLQLRLEEAENLHTICDCGIYCRDAQLPFGWTVHISSQPDTRNRLFFVGPNQESSWDLPMDVVLELTQEQQNVLRDLRSGRYSVQHRPPRARGNSTSSQSKSEQ